MAIFIIPEFSEKLFRRLVELLPAPSEVEVRLYGEFDHRSIYDRPDRCCQQQSWNGKAASTI